MARKRRTTDKNNIVIVCEGTDTEVKYLTDLKKYIENHFPDRFTDIRIVPTAEELVAATNRNKNKKLKEANPWAYYIQEEENEEDFNTYRSQPTRYVREAELFTLNNGYIEAWAVYDFDNFPDHELAKKHADKTGVNVAFSSISFEEWILAHFERNEKAFNKSVCKENKEDIMCGTGAHINDCHGAKCVGGHIRECNHIPEYGKNMDGLFKLLFDKHKVAIVNASWTRGLHHQAKDKPWECNPLTTVDRLIARLLDYKQEYSWIYDPGNLAIDRTILNISEKMVTNSGENSVAFSYRVYDARMEEIEECNTGIILPGNTIQLQIPENGKFLGIIDRKDIKITPL